MKKNKLLNLFLVNLVIFTSFSCNNIEKVKEKEPIKEVIKESIKPSASVLSTPTPTSTPTTSPSILEINSNNISTPLAFPKDLLLKMKKVNVPIIVYTDNSLVRDVNVKAILLNNQYNSNYNKYYFSIMRKTNIDGEVNFDLPDGLNFKIVLDEDGFTRRNITIITDSNQPIYNKYSLFTSKNPEIRDITINSKKTKAFYEIYNKYRNQVYDIFKDNTNVNESKYNYELYKYTYSLKTEILEPWIFLDNDNEINIIIEFNTAINSKSFENSIKIKNLGDNNTIENINFNWFDDNKKSILSFKVSSSEKNTKYKLFFSSKFLDNLGNAFLDRKVFNFNREHIDEMSDFLIFEVKGKV
ncbi:MAG: hypothetical protein U0457_18785 [Candidatus Sericytochromatia bacterium]